MAGRVLLVLALLVGAAVVLFWRPARPPPQDVPREPTAADLVVALEEGDASVLPKLLALKQEGIAALEQRLAASGRGILDLVPRKDDPRDRLIAALEAFGPAAEPALVRVLKALPEKAARIAAALEAIGAKSPEAIEALLLVLQRDHEIESALTKAGSAAIAGLAEALLDEERCDGAARALAALGAKAELRAALAPDAPPKSRAAAARALGDIRDASAREALLAMVVEEEDDEIVTAAASGLCGIGAEDALLERARSLADKGPVFDGAVERKSEAFLLRAVRDEDEELQRGGFGGFARVGPLPPEAVPLAKKALAGKARETAAEALGSGCDDPEVPRLLLALAKEDRDPYVRIRAGEAYWRLGGDAQEVIPILVAELPLKADLHHLVGSMKQNAASKALARLGAVAVPALVDALDTDDDFARDQAATALYDIGRPVHAGEARLRELADSHSAKISDQAKRLLDWLAKLPQGPGS